MTKLKKVSSECQCNNLQDSLVKDMTVCGTRDNSMRESLLRECDLTPSKAINTGHAAEETRKNNRAILISQPTGDIYTMFKRKLKKISDKTRNQNTRDFIKKCNFAIVHIFEVNAQLLEKFVMLAIKGTDLNFAACVLVKKFMKLKRMNLMNSPTRTIRNFLLKLCTY